MMLMLALAAGHAAFRRFWRRKQRGHRRRAENKNQARCEELANQPHVANKHTMIPWQRKGEWIVSGIGLTS